MQQGGVRGVGTEGLLRFVAVRLGGPFASLLTDQENYPHLVGSCDFPSGRSRTLFAKFFTLQDYTMPRIVLQEALYDTTTSSYFLEVR